jgi:chromosome segregation ATPase
MGRPPLGDAAMTSAERVRRWRERHGNLCNETRNEKPCNETSNETIATLEARIRELEELLALPAKDVWVRLKNAVSALRAAKNARKKEAREELREELEALNAKIDRFQSDPEGARAKEIEALRKQLKAARTEIANMKADRARAGISRG